MLGGYLPQRWVDLGERFCPVFLIKLLKALLLFLHHAPIPFAGGMWGLQQGS